MGQIAKVEVISRRYDKWGWWFAKNKMWINSRNCAEEFHNSRFTRRRLD